VSGGAGSYGAAARRLLRAGSVGLLSTHSKELPGYPFGSLVPYALDDGMMPLVLLSDLAQHAANLAADPRASLLVVDPRALQGDPQAAARLVWVCDVERVDGEGEDAARAQQRHASYFPRALRTRDFHLHRLRLKRAQWIGGFGEIGWLEPSQLVLENALRTVGRSIVAHMNDDHAGALALLCEQASGARPVEAAMVGIDPEGFDVLADGRRARFAFDALVFTPTDARAAIVAMVQRARESLATGH